MYDTFLSSQWVFDRCLELNQVATPLSIIIPLIFSLIYLKISNKKLSNKFILLKVIFVIFYTWTFTMSISFLGGWLMHMYPSLNLLIVLFFISMPLLLFIVPRLLPKVSKIKNAMLKKFAFIFFVLLQSISFVPVALFMVIFGGYVVIGCSDGAFWSAVWPSHQVHAVLKNNKLEGNGLPKSEEELTNLDKMQYPKIAGNAKIRYIYNEQEDSYTWFVRPSKYYVAIFDSKKDYAIYKLNDKMSHLMGAKNYPPDYPGPWNQLPK